MSRQRRKVRPPTQPNPAPSEPISTTALIEAEYRQLGLDTSAEAQWARVEAVLDAIAALPYLERNNLLVKELARIAGTRIEEVRAWEPESRDSRIHLVLHFLQNRLAGMRPNQFHPEKPVSFVGQRIERATERMMPRINELHSEVLTFKKGSRAKAELAHELVKTIDDLLENKGYNRDGIFGALVEKDGHREEKKKFLKPKWKGTEGATRMWKGYKRAAGNHPKAKGKRGAPKKN